MAGNRKSRAAAGRGPRPGARKHKAMGKGLPAEEKALVKQARQAAKGGDHGKAAQIFETLAGKLSGSDHALAARAWLRAARSRHVAGDESGRDRALDSAIAEAKATGNKKMVLTHFRDLVRRVRQKNPELADHIQSKVKEGLGRTKLGRTNGEGRARVGGGRRRQA